MNLSFNGISEYFHSTNAIDIPVSTVWPCTNPPPVHFLQILFNHDEYSELIRILWFSHETHNAYISFVWSNLFSEAKMVEIVH